MGFKRLFPIFLSLYLCSLIQAQLLCDDGKFVLIDVNGTAPLPLYTGTSNYQDNFRCLWVIQPSTQVTSITLIFTFLDIEFNWDYLNVYLGTDTINGVLYNSYTGYKAPDILSLQSTAVTLEFISDESIDFTGFSVNYYSSYLTTSCTHGYGIGNNCLCFVGWSGANCDMPACTNSCSGQGNCVNGTCVCAPGYMGGDCSKKAASWCDNTTVPTYSGASGSFQDHKYNDDYTSQAYRPNTNCSWIINSTPGYPFTLVMDHHQVQYPYDIIAVYDGNGNLVAVWSSDGYPIDPVIIPTDTAKLTFTSDNTVEYSGFEASWYSFALCPNSCSGNGWCVDSICRCYPGFTGSYCEQVQPAGVLMPDIVWQSTILDWETHLFQVDVTYPITAFILDFSRHPLHNPPYARWGGGFPQFGIARNAYPTRNGTVLTNNYWFNYFDDAVIVEYPPLGTYYIAVYGLEESGYAISVRPFIPLNGNTPTANSQMISSAQVNSSGLTAAIVIIVVIIVVLVALAGGVFWWRRRKGRNFAFMKDESHEAPAQTKLEDQ